MLVGEKMCCTSVRYAIRTCKGYQHSWFYKVCCKRFRLGSRNRRYRRRDSRRRNNGSISTTPTCRLFVTRTRCLYNNTSHETITVALVN